MKIKIYCTFIGGFGYEKIPHLIYEMETPEDIKFIDEIQKEIDLDLNENSMVLNKFYRDFIDGKINLSEYNNKYL